LLGQCSRLFDNIGVLEEQKATMEEVRRVLGPPGPDGVFEHPGSIIWVYVAPYVEGYSLCGIVIVFNPLTRRMTHFSILRS
jgi:hypothetical protein